MRSRRGTLVGVVLLGVVACGEPGTPPDAATVPKQAPAPGDAALTDTATAFAGEDIETLLRDAAPGDGRAPVGPARTDPELAGALAAAHRVAAEAGAAWRAAVAAGGRRVMRSRREAWEAAREAEAEVALRVHEALAAARAPSTPLLEDLQHALRPAERYVAFDLDDRGSRALVVGPDEARTVPLAAKPRIQAAVTRLDGVFDEAAADEANATLRALLVEPLDLPEAAGTVLVVPAGPLHRVPLAALFGGRIVARVPGAAWLVATRREARGVRERVLAYGDPAYDVAPPTHGTRALPRIPATAAEARTVGDVVRIGRDATERRLRQDLAWPAAWRAVHLATQVTFDPRHPLSSAIHLVGDDADDGALTVAEVMQLTVDADLVVLAAGESGEGRPHASGWIGLPAAFLHAGARSVIASLTVVDGEATRTFVRALYDAWEDRSQPVDEPSLGRAVAAAREVLRRGPDPERRRAADAWALWGLPE